LLLGTTIISNEQLVISSSYYMFNAQFPRISVMFSIGCLHTIICVLSSYT
jgi:hypothetical protein